MTNTLLICMPFYIAWVSMGAIVLCISRKIEKRQEHITDDDKVESEWE